MLRRCGDGGPGPRPLARAPAAPAGTRAGFLIERFDGHAYVQTLEPQYLLTPVDRGADAPVSAWRIGRGLADALKAEARRRVESKEFCGSITFASLIARRPAEPRSHLRADLDAVDLAERAGERRHVALALALGGGEREDLVDRLAEEGRGAHALGQMGIVRTSFWPFLSLKIMPPWPESTQGMKRWKTDELAPPSLTTSNSFGQIDAGLGRGRHRLGDQAAVPWLKSC